MHFAAAGQQWYSWVEFVSHGQKQKPKVFCSHWWGGRFPDFMHIIEACSEVVTMGMLGRSGCARLQEDAMRCIVR